MSVKYYPPDWLDKHDYRQVKFDTFEEMLDYLAKFHTDFNKEIRKLKIDNIMHNPALVERNLKTFYYDKTLYDWIY